MPTNYDEASEELPASRVIHLRGHEPMVEVEIAGFRVPLDQATAERATRAVQDGDWDEVGRILAGVAADGSIPDHATLHEKAKISAQIAELQRRYAELDAIPPEPRSEDSPHGVAVLQFDKQYGTNTTYSYAAVRLPAGRWSVSGKQAAGKLFTWPELWKFINQGENKTPAVWFANGFDQL